MECGTACDPNVNPPAAQVDPADTATVAEESTGPLAGAVSARRVVPVLFGDLVGFTSLSESRDQEEVRELLSEYFEVCRSVLERHGGVVEKFIGDAVMAVWGLPVTREDDAERAVRAGLELVDAVEALGERVGVEGLAMRVGVVTGDVAVTLGARGQGMVAGDPVNTASRVQGVAAPGQVLVDETTRSLSQAAITYAAAGSHSLKGKEHPVALWAAEAVVAAVGGAQRADGLEAPLVGRDRELRLVKELFHRTEETRTPGLMLVSAGPGLGKSRLGWEFSKYVDGLEDPTRWLEGRCPAYGDGAAYHALAEAVRGRLRAFDDDRSHDLGTVLDAFLAEYVPDPGDQAWLRSPVASLLGLPGAGPHSRQELFAAWMALLQALAVGSTAVVLVIEDAQNADEGLVAFLEFALTVRGLPLFVLLLARPELLIQRPTLTANPRVVTTHLEELGTDQMGALVSSLVSGLPQPVLDGLVERACGVPLFAVETVRSLIDKDLVVAEGGRYVLVDRGLDLAEIAAPASLHTLIASRLDALPADLRRVIDLASVLGGSFKPEALATLVGTDAIEPLLDGLVRRQFLEVESNRLAGEFGWYSFAQDAVRQVAYSMLARRDRRAAHLAVAEALATTDAPAELPMRAQHLAAAAEAVPGEPDVPAVRARAADAVDAASVWALGLGSWDDAIAHVERALELVEEATARVRLLCRISVAAQASGDWDRGVTAGREAIELGRTAGDESGEALAAGLTGFLLTRQGRYGEALRLVEPYWERFRARADADEAVYWVARALCLGHGAMGRWEQSAAQVMVTIGERTGDRTKTITGMSYLATALYHDGLRDTARILMTGAAALAREHGLKEAESTALANLGSLVLDDDLPAAAEATRASSLIDREMRSSDGSTVCVENLAEAFHRAGDWDQREELLRDEAGDIPPGFLLRLAEATALIAMARGESVTEIDVPDAGSDPFGHAIAVLLNARIGVYRGDHVEVFVPVAESLHMLREAAQGDDWLTYLVDPDIRALLEPAEWTSLTDELEDRPDHMLPNQSRGNRHRLHAQRELMRSGPSPAVVDALRAAITAYKAWGGHVALAQAKAELADVLTELGEHEEASRLRTEVRETHERLGARAWLADLDRAEALLDV
jgi:class 3 adenylate cyclase/tetratricopeptide (TPR) repeat protein